jgi:orotate phosphoribosyltransferase
VREREIRGRRIAKYLIDIGAVTLSPDQPFTWASGLKSPIYCDNRATLAYPDIRNEIAQGFVELIGEGGYDVDAVVGVATGAIAHASFVAAKSGHPLGYIRSAAKEHGRGNRLEGFVRIGARVVVIEDLISTGGSSISAVKGVRESEMDVAAVLAIFTYGLPAADAAFQAADVNLTTLVNLGDLVSVARVEGVLDEAGEAALEAWVHDPQGWSAAQIA